MTEPMQVRVEVWPVAADPLGIWLVAPEGDAWRSGPVPGGGDPHQTVQEVLAAHGEPDTAVLVHSTSWRVDGALDAVVLSYVAVLGGHGYAGHPDAGGHGDYQFVRDVWPQARPLTLRLAEAAGRPLWHEAASPPTPRYLDVLWHAVRHLRFLLDTDTSARGALDEHWHAHLADLQPTLAGLYRHDLLAGV